MRTTAWLLSCLACAALLPAAAAGPDYGRYQALVIGNYTYKHLPKLETAEKDARVVHELLAREYGYQSVLLLNATRDELIRNLDRLRQELTERDNLLIYYAGHGHLDKLTGEGFWLPVDAEEDSQVEWIPLSTVTRMLLASTAKHAIVVADSCYSGTLTRDSGAHLATGAGRAAELKRLSQKRARKALTSGGLEPVVDGGRNGHSVFAGAFLDALRGNREVIDGHQLYLALRRNVVLNARQTPQYADIRFAGDEGGDFLFVPVPARGEPAGRRGDPTGQRSEPAGPYLSGIQVRQALLGNTLNFDVEGVGAVYIFFEAGGVLRVQRQDKPGQTFKKQWWIKDGSELCRTIGTANQVHCGRMTWDQTAGTVQVFKPDGGLRYEARLLQGRHLQE